MSKSKSSDNRILAIYPNSRGFGFVLMEGRDVLVDWGVIGTKNDKHRRGLVRIKDFVAQYRPDAVLTEDHQKCLHRGTRIRELLAAIRKTVLKMGIRHEGVTRDQVRKWFQTSGRVTKHQMAQLIAERFPELASRLPPPRKPWMSEDSRMAIFDAVALALSGEVG